MKKFASVLLIIVMLLDFGAIPCFADDPDCELLPADIGTAVCVRELNSCTDVLCRHENDPLPMGHTAKLMTLLICAESLESGGLSFSDDVLVTESVGSMPPPVIWLKEGEHITVGELAKSLAMGNSNDACTALAEKLSGSAEKHIARMNARAAALGMNSTYFADCCGLDKSTVSTANDITVLMGELVKHESLSEYFTLWTDRVRGGETELVNTNRLVRSCKGLVAGKYCADNSGCSITAAVERNGMIFCVTILGCNDRDRTFSAARNCIDGCFEGYRLYVPDIKGKYPESVMVTGGRKPAVGVKDGGFDGVLLPRGVSSRVDLKITLPEQTAAPVGKGNVLGRVECTLDGEKIAEIHLVAAETVERTDWGFGIYRCLCNLFKL